MKLAIFGATGRVGSELVKRALNDGHEVRALVRRADLDRHSNLQVIVGEARDERDIKRTIEGTDAVFSALGTDQSTTLSEAMPLLVDSMKGNGIRRLITIGTAGILNSRQTPGVLRYQGGDSNRKLTFAAEEHEKVYRLLEKTDLDWTIVCPTYLPDGEAQGGLRFEKDFLPEGGKQVTVGDTAEFTYSQLENKEFIGSRVGIAY